jgi:subtilase family serine protease
VTETVRNQGAVAAGASTMRYYLSIDALRNSGDVRLGGSRPVPGLAASATSAGSAAVAIPITAPGGSFYLLACADDTNAVPETSESDNCRASEARVNVLVFE